MNSPGVPQAAAAERQCQVMIEPPPVHPPDTGTDTGTG